MNSQLQIAIEACLKAGKAVMEVYDTVFEVEYKDDKSPLTLADKRANEIINNYLTPTGIPIISEENKQIEYQERKDWKQCWVVDPVDGTKEFVKRNGEFTVNIALIEDQKPVLGVIYAPAIMTLYFAESTSKAYQCVVDSHDISLDEVLQNKVELNPTTATNSNLVRVIGSRSHMSQETLDYIQTLEQEGKKVEIVSKGSSLKFCLVAEGKADVYPRYAPTMEWDTAAGQAICIAVGFDVISKETNNSLLYNKENLLNPWFLVTR